MVQAFPQFKSRMRRQRLIRPTVHPVSTVDYVTGIGDSTTAGTAASDAAHRWLNLLQAQIDATSLTGASALANDGSAGESIGHMIRRIYGYGLENRGVIAILAGFNDMRLGYTVDGFGDNLNALINYYKPTADIVIVGNIPHMIDYSNPALSPHDQGSAALTVVYNKAVRTIAQQNGVLFADVYGGMGQDNALISGDDIHPNDAGHQAICDAFWFVLEDYIRPTAVTRPETSMYPLLPIADPRMGSTTLVTWSTYQATFTRDVSVVWDSGIASAKVTCTVSPGALYQKGVNAGERPPWFASTPTYIEAYVKADAATSPTTCWIRSNEYDAAKNYIAGTSHNGTSAAVTNSAWTKLTHTFITSATCVGLEPNVVLEGVGNIVYVGNMAARASVPQ